MVDKEERFEIAQELRRTSYDSLGSETLQRALARVTEARDTSWRGVLRRLAELIELQPIDGNTSDGYHTFNELYHHRAVLFSVIVANFAARAWKSKLHADGTMYDGMFIVGIETPDGQATYHYDIDPYWNLFRCTELGCAPEWDGHTPNQAIERIGKLADLIDRPTCENLATKSADELLCSECGEHVDIAYMENADDYHARYCPNCGARVVSGDE